MYVRLMLCLLWQMLFALCLLFVLYGDCGLRLMLLPFVVMADVIAMWQMVSHYIHKEYGQESVKLW